SCRQLLKTGLVLPEAPSSSAADTSMLLQGEYGYGDILRFLSPLPVERRLRPGLQSAGKRSARAIRERLAALWRREDGKRQLSYLGLGRWICAGQSRGHFPVEPTLHNRQEAGST